MLRYDFTLVTATLKVYSVMRLGVLLVNVASIDISEPSAWGLETRKAILTEVFEMTRSLVDGKLVASSGKAEAKSQSSSAEAPLLVCCDVDVACAFGGGGFGEAKSKSDGEGDWVGTCDCWVLEEDEACRKAGEDRAANGSDEDCGDFDACCDWRRDGGAGVADLEEG